MRLPAPDSNIWHYPCDSETLGMSPVRLCAFHCVSERERVREICARRPCIVLQHGIVGRVPGHKYVLLSVGPRDKSFIGFIGDHNRAGWWGHSLSLCSAALAGGAVGLFGILLVRLACQHGLQRMRVWLLW